MKNSFCIVPFTEINIIHDRVGYCCLNQESFALDQDGVEHTLSKFSTFDKTKAQLLSGIKPTGCNKCYFQESSGGTSSRLFRNELYQKENGIDFETMVERCRSGNIGIVQIFMFFSNLCNLACRMCVPESSSTIASLLKIKVHQDGKITDEKRVELYKEILKRNRDSVRKITFSGGEFFMDPKCLAFLQDEEVLSMLKTLEKVIINTNASKLQHGKLDFLSIIEQLNNIILNVSIDGPPGPVFDYIRERIDSKEFDATLKKLIEITGSKRNVIFSFTLQTYNVLYITETLQYILENFDQNTMNVFLYRWVFNRELDIRVLPRDILEKAITKMDAFDIRALTDNQLIIGQFETLKTNVKTVLREPRDLIGFEQFKEAIKKLDGLHGTDVLSILPELEGQI